MKLDRALPSSKHHQFTTLQARDIREGPCGGIYWPKMLSRRLLAARPLARTLRTPLATRAFSRTAIVQQSQADIDDPGMNGGYPVLPAIKRQHRDPYAGWWDEQERRNYGEDLHEDDDLLAMFSTEDYTWTTAGWGWVLVGTFVSAVLGLCTICYFTYPDRPAMPRTFPGGLEEELGGKGTIRALKPGEDEEIIKKKLGIED